MLDRKGTILYIGKAKNLKKRVSSYFLSSSNFHPKTRALVSLITDFDTIITSSEYEAFVLESQLIKDNQPKYNISLKDDKSYPFIKITNEPFPRVISTRRRYKDGATYYGPFPSIGSSRRFVQLLEEFFPIRDCKQKIDAISIQPKCIKLDIGRCIGPCLYKNIQSEYTDIIKDVDMLLSGKSRILINQMQKKMKTAADMLDFEKAAKLRDKISNLEKVYVKQHVFLTESLNAQVWACVDSGGKRYIMTQVIIDGKLTNQYGLFYDLEDEKLNPLESVVFQQFSQIQTGVQDIICSENLLNAFLKINLEEFKRISIHCPKIGAKKRMVVLAQKNAEYAIQKVIEKESESKGSIGAGLDMLRKVLKLNTLPVLIFGFDISHHQGENIVAAAVTFKFGKPYKSLYRRYTIRSVKDKSNDPKSIYEAVFRRVSGCVEKKQVLPDLLVIDGGKPQLNAALRAVRDVGIVLPVVSLAKREEELFMENFSEPLKLNEGCPALRICQNIRDEAHRFSNDFQRLKRTKSYGHSRLHAIPGVGNARINALFVAFGSVELVKVASVEDVSNVGNIGKVLAEKILRELK
jgi:excinuclease ABC subunit C